MTHKPGVFEDLAPKGWHRIVAVGFDGEVLAISEFREGVCDVQSETRRLLAKVESGMDSLIAEKPRVALMR